MCGSSELKQVLRVSCFSTGEYSGNTDDTPPLETAVWLQQGSTGSKERVFFHAIMIED